MYEPCTGYFDAVQRTKKHWISFYLYVRRQRQNNTRHTYVVFYQCTCKSNVVTLDNGQRMRHRKLPLLLLMFIVQSKSPSFILSKPELASHVLLLFLFVSHKRICLNKLLHERPTRMVRSQAKTLSITFVERVSFSYVCPNENIEPNSTSLAHGADQRACATFQRPGTSLKECSFSRWWTHTHTLSLSSVSPPHSLSLFMRSRPLWDFLKPNNLNILNIILPERTES